MEVELNVPDGFYAEVREREESKITPSFLTEVDGMPFTELRKPKRRRRAFWYE